MQQNKLFDSERGSVTVCSEHRNKITLKMQGFFY